MAQSFADMTPSLRPSPIGRFAWMRGCGSMQGPSRTSWRMVVKLPRRTFLHLAAGAAALPTVSRMARAQAYPTRPVRIIVGFPAGGATDILARLTAQWLSDRLGQQ